jgi:hypothetical protein
VTTGLVSFYLPEREAIAGVDLARVRADRDWTLFGTAVYVWILQTYIRLRDAGADVALVEDPPESGIVVAHADHVNRLLAGARNPPALTVVCARSDKPPHPLADFEIVQNASSVVEAHQRFIPSWGQPGLIPRAPERAATVETIAYVGSGKELDPGFAGPEWSAFLDARGMRWDPRTITFAGSDRRYADVRWNDYSAADVVVALRPRDAWNVRSKPAAKLQNAWTAGVPAIVSPEAAYAELRRSPLDYLEAASVRDVMEAIDRLRSDPGLYRAMVENGLVRARDFTPERVTARWKEVLYEDVPAQARTLKHRLLARERRWRAALRRARRRFGTALER